jgi:hypothetical protein
MNTDKIKMLVKKIHTKYNSIDKSMPVDSSIYEKELHELKKEWLMLFTEKDAGVIILDMAVNDFLDDYYTFEDDYYDIVIDRINKDCQKELKKESYNINSILRLLLMGLVLADY